MIDLMKMHTVNKGDATKAEEYQQKLVSIMQLLEDQKHLKFKNSSVLCEELNNKVNYQVKQSINLLISLFKVRFSKFKKLLYFVLAWNDI